MANKRGAPYRCPVCGSADVRIYDTLGIQEYERAFVRRRKCTRCHYRWKTYEIEADEVDRIIKWRAAVEAIERALEKEG